MNLYYRNFYIFISSYLRMKPLSLMKALIGLQSLPTAVTSDNWKSAQLFVIPRRDSKHLVEPMVFSLDEPLFTIHLGNAHEKDNRLVIYTCSFKTFSIGNELGYYPCRPGYFNPLANGGGAPQCLLRIDVDWKRNQLNKKWVDFSACDFPEVHPYQEVSEEKKNVGFFIKHGNRVKSVDICMPVLPFSMTYFSPFRPL